MGTALTSGRILKLAEHANRLHAKVVISAKSTVQLAIECGVILESVRENLPHGEWESWVETNTEISLTQARNYIRLASADPSEIDYDLSMRANVKKLSKPKEPNRQRVADLTTGDDEENERNPSDDKGLRQSSEAPKNGGKPPGEIFGEQEDSSDADWGSPTPTVRGEWVEVHDKPYGLVLIDPNWPEHGRSRVEGGGHVHDRAELSRLIGCVTGGMTSLSHIIVILCPPSRIPMVLESMAKNKAYIYTTTMVCPSGDYSDVCPSLWRAAVLFAKGVNIGDLLIRNDTTCLLNRLRSLPLMRLKYGGPTAEGFDQAVISPT